MWMTGAGVGVGVDVAVRQAFEWVGARGGAGNRRWPRLVGVGLAMGELAVEPDRRRGPTATRAKLF